MELINKNREIIVNWYKKQQLPTPPNLFGMNFDCLTKCCNVKEELLQKIEKCFTVRPVKIVINPLLTRNLCHNNCETMLKVLNKNRNRYKQVLGYVITCCGCNELFTLELHSVLVHIPTNEYIDLTTDYAGERFKYFIPVKDIDNLEMIGFIKNFRGEFFHSKKYHRCKVDRGLIYESDSRTTITNDLDEFQRFIYKMIQTTIIIV